MKNQYNEGIYYNHKKCLEGNRMKNIIITGGASGIGLATAKKLSKDNNVIIVDYKDINQDFIQNNFEYYKNVYFFNGGFTLK